MASRKQRPVRLTDVRLGHTYYMPVPAHQTCRGGDACACRQAGLEPGQGCSPVPAGCLRIVVNCRQQVVMIHNLLRSGTLLYRSKAKAKRQGLQGVWLRPWRQRAVFN